MNKYIVETTVSEVFWRGHKPIGKTEHGTVKVKSGEVTVADNKITAGKVTIDMTTIDALDVEGGLEETLENHLKSDDFFSVEKYPEVTYEITSADEKEITGKLSIKGHTEEVPGKITAWEVEDHKIMFRADFVFDRSKFDVRYGSGSFFSISKLGDALIDDEIKISVEVVATR